MIFNSGKIYGKVWKITKNEKYLDLQMSTSEKNQDGTYVNSSWFPRVIGHAFNSLKDTLKEGDRILITKSKFSNERYTAKDGTTKSAFRFLILEAQKEDQEQKPQPAASQQPAATEPMSEEAVEDSPW